MLLRAPLLLVGILLVLRFETAFAEEPNESVWSSRVRAYGTSGGAVGIHHVLGPRWEIGLQALVAADQSDSERLDTVFEQRLDRTTLALDLYPELRRRIGGSGSVTTYWGVQGRYSYRHWQNVVEYTDPPREERDDDFETVVGVAATFGAAVRVHRHVGISADIVPVALDYAWTRAESRSIREESDETREGEGNDLGLDVAISPALYVVIYF